MFGTRFTDLFNLAWNEAAQVISCKWCGQTVSVKEGLPRDPILDFPDTSRSLATASFSDYCDDCNSKSYQVINHLWDYRAQYNERLRDLQEKLKVYLYTGQILSTPGLSKQTTALDSTLAALFETELGY